MSVREGVCSGCLRQTIVNATTGRCINCGPAAASDAQPYTPLELSILEKVQGMAPRSENGMAMVVNVAEFQRLLATAKQGVEGPLLVLHKRDAEPWQVLPSTNATDVLALYERLQENWSETYLVRVLKGPRDFMQQRAAVERGVRETPDTEWLNQIEWFGCMTGDCPHDKQAQCDVAILSVVRSVMVEREAARFAQAMAKEKATRSGRRDTSESERKNG